MKIAETKSVPVGDLKVGDVIIVAVCPKLDSGGEPHGYAAARLETIVGILPDESYALKLKTKWKTEYSSGDSLRRYPSSAFVTVL